MKYDDNCHLKKFKKNSHYQLVKVKGLLKALSLLRSNPNNTEH